MAMALLWPGTDAFASVRPRASVRSTDSSESCLRIVRNQLSGFPGGWGQAGAPVAFADGQAVSSFTGVGSASFSLQGSSILFSLLGTQVSFIPNATYSIRVTVSDYAGNYAGTNFQVLAATPENFSGLTHLNFIGNGTYALVFTYTGPASAQWLIRVGINTDAAPIQGGGPGGFTVSNVSLEQLPGPGAVPSEYVASGYAWGFNYPLANVYDSGNGKLSESTGPPCASSYSNVWAVTADSFGDNGYSFPSQLANNLGQDFVLFVDSVAGRTLAAALTNVDSLLANMSFIQTNVQIPAVLLPSTVARPNGLIVEGGVNDIVQNSSAAELEAVAAAIIDDVTSKNLGAILLTVGPFGNNANWTSSREAVRLDYNQWLRSQAAASRNVYVYDMAAPAALGGLADDTNPSVIAAAYDIGDGLHPNLAGGQQIARQILTLLGSGPPPVSATTTTIAAGQATTLTVRPSGSGPFTYQWYVGTVGNTSNPIAGATGPSVTVAPSGTTSYWVLVTGPGGSQGSTAVVITVSGAGTGGSTASGTTDGPMPLWSLCALGAALIGVAVRRSTRAV